LYAVNLFHPNRKERTAFVFENPKISLSSNGTTEFEFDAAKIPSGWKYELADDGMGGGPKWLTGVPSGRTKSGSATKPPASATTSPLIEKSK
jgi:hypothetical protein